MSTLKKLLVSACALGLTLVTGLAQAEVVTYEFTATIDSDYDPSNVLAYGQGDVVTGTFSYDTEASVLAASGHGALYNTGVVNTGLTKTAPDAGTTSVVDFYVFDRVDVVDYGSSTGTSGFGFESVSFAWGNALQGIGLPSTLSLDDFAAATYALKSSGRLVSGAISSLTKIVGGSTNVPELSASSAASSLLLLVGAALMLSRRRQLGIQHS